MTLPLKYRLAVFLLNIISSTWRYKINGEISPSPSIIAFWHGTMLPVWKYFAKEKPYAVVSQSKDGAILTQLLKNWGYKVLRGSSSKGSKQVLSEMQSVANNGYLLITPDGPRGPIHEFKAGAVIIAHRAEVPLQLCGVKIYWQKLFSKSWDKFSLPLPFSKIELYFSPTLIISKNANRDEVSAQIHKAQMELNKLSGIK
jgi:lysophospholipid acyltransferase (LPLAT)-like uncharacterized protein